MRILRFLTITFLFLSAIASGANVSPEIVQQAVAPSLVSGGAVKDLNLAPLFRDPDVLGSAVRLSIRIGTATQNVDLSLFDASRPITAANFLAYVNSGAFQTNIFHRSVPGFIVQTGGFRWNASNNIESVPTSAAIQNEPGISNLRGSVAMAKIGGDPNSATSGWFVNLSDTNAANLDAQNGGFTVFGRVLGTGMTVFDEIAALQVVNQGGAFTDLPVKNYISGNVTRANSVEMNAAQVAPLAYSATSDNPSLVAVSLTGSALHFTPSASGSGSTTVHITATDLEGGQVVMDLGVTVANPQPAWHIETGAGGALTFVFNPAVASLTTYPVDYGQSVLGVEKARTFSLRNDSGATINGVSAAVSGANVQDFAVTTGAGPRAIAAGETVVLAVAFTPTAIGSRGAQVSIRTGDTNFLALDLQATGAGKDIPPPVISGVLAQTLAADAVGSATMPDLRGTVVAATDTLAITTFAQSPTPGTALSLGASVLSFSATNSAGKTATAQTTVTVRFVNSTLAVLAASARTGAAIAGGTMGTLGTPAISDFRDMAARITLTTGQGKVAAIYTENGAGVGRIVAQQGGVAVVAGAVFKSFRDPLLAPNGKLAFSAKLAGAKAGEDEGVWTDLFGSLAPVLREGAPVPGLSALRLASVLSVSLTDRALIALVKLAPSSGLVTAASDTALIRITGTNSAVVLARTGSALLGSVVKKVTTLQPARASAGQGRWHGTNNAIAKLTLADKRVVLAKAASNGALTLLLGTNEIASGFAKKLSTLGIPSLGGASVALLAQKAAQLGVTTANDMALLFAADGTSFTELASEQAGLGNFASFSDPASNAQGNLLFSASRRGATTQTPATRALWQSIGGATPTSVAALGAAAPDAAGTAIANTEWSQFTTFALPDDGGPVFIAQVKGKAVTSHTKLGLWAADSTGLVRQILRTGASIPLPSGAKTLTGFTLLNALPGSFGARRSYNATRSLAVQATFSDHTQALLRVDVP